MKFVTNRPLADPEKAARRLMEHAQAFEPIQDGRIYIEKINGPFLFGDKGTPAEYSAGLELAISRGWMELHECRLGARVIAPIRVAFRHRNDVGTQDEGTFAAQWLAYAPLSTLRQYPHGYLRMTSGSMRFGRVGSRRGPGFE